MPDEPNGGRLRTSGVQPVTTTRRSARPADPDDRALAGRLRAGEHAALAAAYDRYGAACYGLARRILGDEVLAQDVVQEVFVALWRRPAAYDPDRGRLATWLLTVTHRRAVDAVRREQVHRGRRLPLEAVDQVAGDQAGPDEVAEAGLRRAAAREALGQLAPAQRQALELAYYGGLTQREIAAVLDVPLGTVKTRMFAGLGRLRALLGEES